MMTQYFVRLAHFHFHHQQRSVNSVNLEKYFFMDLALKQERAFPNLMQSWKCPVVQNVMVYWTTHKTSPSQTKRAQRCLVRGVSILLAI